MICGQCGHANPPHAPVCERCGAPLGGRVTAPGHGEPRPIPQTSEQPQRTGFGPPPAAPSHPPPASHPPPPMSEPPPGFSAPPPPAPPKKAKKGGGLLFVVILLFFVFAGAGSAVGGYFLWYLPSQEEEVAEVDAEPPVEEPAPAPAPEPPPPPAPAPVPEPEPEPEPVPAPEPAPEPEPEPEEPEPAPVEEPASPAPSRPARTWQARARAAVQSTARQCFVQNGAHGSVMVQVSISHDGRITTSRVVNNSTANQGVARCISGALVGRRIGTHGPRGGTTLNIAFSG